MVPLLFSHGGGSTDVYCIRAGGGGGTLIFSSYDIWNIRHTQKIFEILSTPQISPFKVQEALFYVGYI